MKFFRIFLLLLIVIGVGLLITQKIWVPHVVDALMKKYNNSDSAVVLPVSQPHPVAVAQNIRSITMSSSTPSRVGDFTALVTCKNKNPVKMGISKDGSTTQTFDIWASDTGVPACPPAIAKDVNFDGYLDVMLLSNTGTGGGALTYWLYSTSTDSFTCPNPRNDECVLMNPVFDPTSKTIVSRTRLGADTVDVTTYGIENGKLVVVKHERFNN